MDLNKRIEELERTMADRQPEAEPGPEEPSPEKTAQIIAQLEEVLNYLRAGWVKIEYNQHFARSSRADGLPVYPYQFWFNSSTCPGEKWDRVGHVANWLRRAISETYATFEMDCPETKEQIIDLVELELRYCRTLPTN